MGCDLYKGVIYYINFHSCTLLDLVELSLLNLDVPISCPSLNLDQSAASFQK